MTSRRNQVLNGLVLIIFIGLCGMALTWTTPSIHNELSLGEGISIGDTIYITVIRGNETTDSDDLEQSPIKVKQIPMESVPH